MCKQVEAVRDLAAKELLDALERCDHRVGVAAAERHHVDRRELQVRRHTHLGNGDDVAFEIGIVDLTLRQNLGNCMANGFADAQLTL